MVKLNILAVCNFFQIWQLALWSTSQAINPCGNFPKGDCLISCHNTCKDLHSRGSGMSDEEIGTKKNLCDSRCFGKMYNPSKELGDGSFIHHPGYSENEICIGICAYPAPKYCLKGYISQFFYCDCHTCCLQNPDRDARVKCAEACHLWFMKQWSPKRNESCRFRPSYSLTKTEWCSAYCAWQITTQSGMSAGPNINNIIASPPMPCVKRCTSLIESGIPVDYDTRPVCTTPLRCLAALVTRFRFTTNVDEDYVKPYIVKHILGGKPFYYANTELRTVSKNHAFTHTWQHALENSIPDALIYLRSIGNNVTVRAGGSLVANTGYNHAIFDRERRIIEELFRKSYASGDAWTTRGTHESVVLENVSFNTTYFIHRCVEANFSSFRLVITKMPVEYEVYIKLFDPTGGLPFTGYDMKTLVSQTPQLSTLEVVQEIDDTTLQVKWKSSMLLTVEMEGDKTTLGSCSFIPGCNTQETRPGCNHTEV